MSVKGWIWCEYGPAGHASSSPLCLSLAPLPVVGPTVFNAMRSCSPRIRRDHQNAQIIRIAAIAAHSRDWMALNAASNACSQIRARTTCRAARATVPPTRATAAASVCSSRAGARSGPRRQVCDRTASFRSCALSGQDGLPVGPERKSYRVGPNVSSWPTILTEIRY